MIIELSSDRPTFRRLQFRAGLNIVLAEKSSTSTDDHRTRNGAGKSSIVDVVRFVLGGDVRKGRDVLAAPELQSDSFEMRFTLAGQEVEARRRINDKGRVTIVSDDHGIFSTPPAIEQDGTVWFTLRTWLDELGRLFF